MKNGLKLLGGGVAALAGLAGLWQLYRTETDRHPRFLDQPVAFNEYAGINDQFIAFLRKNNGEKVFINTVLDFSPSMPEHFDILNACNNAYPKQGQSEQEFEAAGGTFDILERGQVFNRPLRIPHHHRWEGKGADDCPSTLELVFVSTRAAAPMSFGGTGVVRLTLRGNFIVHRSLSGAMETLTLREVDIDEN